MSKFVIVKSTIPPCDSRVQPRQSQTSSSSLPSSSTAVSVSTEEESSESKNPTLQSFSLLDKFLGLLQGSQASKVMRSMKKVGQHYSTVIRVALGVASSGSAAKYGVFSFDPSSVFSDWTSFAALFDEFRMISIKLKFVPYYRYSSTDTGLIAVCGDNDSSTTPASIDTVVQYGNSMVFPVQSHKDHIYHFKRPNITDSAYWVDVATPSNSLGAILYGTLDSTTTNGRGIFYLFAEMYVEFRSRR